MINQRSRNMDELLYELNMMNSQYCALQNRFFAQGLGEQVDYHEYLRSLQSLRTMAADCETTIKALHSRDVDASLPEEYLKCRINSMQFFERIVTKIEGKARGIKYGFIRYNLDVSQLSKEKKNAVVIGERLQAFSEKYYQSEKGKKDYEQNKRDLLRDVRQESS